MSEENKEEASSENDQNKSSGELSQLLSFSAGEIIIQEGKEERIMYIIKKGKVRVYKTYLGKKLTLSVLGKGEVFGELSFFDGKERIASVEGIEAGELIKVEAKKVEKDLGEMPAWMKGIVKTVVTRLRETDEKLTILQNKYDTSNASGKASVLVEDIFNEVARVNQIFRLYFHSKADLGEGESFEESLKDIDFLLHGCFVKAERIFDFYEKNNLIKSSDDNEKKHQLNIEEMDRFDEYIDEQKKADQITFFSRKSLNIMGDTIQLIPHNTSDSEQNTPLIEVVDEEKINKMTNYQVFLKELRSFKLASGNPAKITMTLGDLQRHYKYQSLISIFNLTMD